MMKCANMKYSLAYLIPVQIGVTFVQTQCLYIIEENIPGKTRLGRRLPE